MKKSGAIWLLIILITSCATSSGYYRFYTPYILKDKLIDYQLELLPKDGEPKIYTSNNPSKDIADLETNHYAIIGESAFEGPIANLDGVKAVCKENGATIVLVYSQFLETKTIAGTLSLPTTKTSNVSGSVYGPNGTTLVNGTVTTHGTDNIPYSYQIDRYNQTAVYFAKMNRKFLFGISWLEINSEIQKSVKRNTGVYVRIVYRDTPAFAANILPGDVIIKMGNQEIRNTTEFSQTFAKYKSGDKVSMDIWRNEQVLKFRIKL